MNVMSDIATNRLEFEEGQEIIAHARWLTQEVMEPGVAVQRVAKFLNQSCSDEQKADILVILEEVASVGGEPSGLQMQAIDRLKLKFAGK